MLLFRRGLVPHLVGKARGLDVDGCYDVVVSHCHRWVPKDGVAGTQGQGSINAPGENLARVTECHQILDHLYLIVCGTVKMLRKGFRWGGGPEVKCKGRVVLQDRATENQESLLVPERTKFVSELWRGHTVYLSHAKPKQEKGGKEKEGKK